MTVGPSPSSDPFDRQRFLHLWSRRHEAIRYAAAVAMLLREDHDGILRSYLVEQELEIAQRHSIEEARLVRIRETIRAVSPILLAACAAERVSVAAVAYGILPRAHVPFAGDGTPWSRHDDPTRLAGKYGTCPKRPARQKDRAGRIPGAVLRTRTHPDGQWRVRLVGGILHVDMARGRLALRSSGPHCEAMLDGTMPAGVLAGALGRPVGALIDHPLLGDERYVVTAAQERSGILVIRFRCPPEPIATATLRPEPGKEQHLGRDALRDLVLRCAVSICARRRKFEPSLLVSPLVSPRLVHETVVDHVRTLNLMSPPSVERLERPSFRATAEIVKTSGISGVTAG